MLHTVPPTQPKFKVGDRVVVDGDAAGDYIGEVTKVVPQLTKPKSAFDNTQETKPGVLVKVNWWDSTAVDYDMVIQAWDDEGTLASTVGKDAFCHDCGDPAPKGLYQCKPCHKRAREQAGL